MTGIEAPGEGAENGFPEGVTLRPFWGLACSGFFVCLGQWPRRGDHRPGGQPEGPAGTASGFRR